MIAPTEFACEPCGGSPARVWVQVAEDHQPMCRACSARAAEDAAFLAGLVDAYREPFEDVLPPLRAVVSPPQRQAGQAAQVRRDPRQHLIERGHQLAAIRRRCLGPKCPLVSNPGGLALHQRATGHVGYEEISR